MKLLCLVATPLMLGAEHFNPAGANWSSLVASGRLHASNTIAMSSLSPGVYKISVVCSTSYCLPEPTDIPVQLSGIAIDSLGPASGNMLVSREAAPVHVLWPSVYVQYLQERGQGLDMAQQGGVFSRSKVLLQGLLVLILLGAHGISVALWCN